MACSELPHELGFEPGEHDVRIERPPWVFWIRTVKRYESFTHSPLNGAASDLPGLILTLGIILLLAIFGRVRPRRRARWKVGVLRIKGSRWGPVGRATIVHKQVLPTGVEPSLCIDALVGRVRSGEFDTPDGRQPATK